MLNRAHWCRKRCIGVALAWLCLAPLFSLASVGAAQAVDATRWRSGLVSLDHGWLVHEGDELSWAKTDLDDSGWERVDFADLGATEPGWKWFRLHVKQAPGHEHAHLLVAGGEGIYELYVNGKLMEGARIKPFWGVMRPTEQIFMPRDEDSDLTIAIRMHATSIYTAWHLPPFLTAAIGTEGAIENERLAMESQRLYAAIPSIAINLLLLLVGMGAFALFRSQPGHREYMWLGLYLVLLGVSNGLLYSSASGVVPLAWNNLLADPLIYVFTIIAIEFTFSFAGKRVGRFWRAYEYALLLPLIPASLQLMEKSLTASTYVLIEAIAILPAALLLPVMLFVWYRRGNREAGLLMIPSLLPAAASAVFDLGSASLYMGWGKLDFLTNPIAIGPVSVQLSDAGDFLFALAIGVVMFFRFTRVSREQTRVAAELEAAREIQQRLVPAQLPEVKGYTIEAAYFPAQEVGGDFYQVLAQRNDAELVVVGDVSGKGLRAAMTGTLALGALRALAAQQLGPGTLLTELNRQLAEAHDGGFITCICARVTESGKITVANAGHLPPYRNGEELTVCIDLPLGISPEEVYEECTFQLEPGDRLTLLSDGVPEARDIDGVLFGFERMRAISSKTAAEIADQALRFGQQDDITVLTLSRTLAGIGYAPESHKAAVG